MKLGQEITTCRHNSSITQARVNDNQEDTGYLAVSVIPGDDTDAQSIADTDNDTGLPVPRVKLADTAAEQIYGVLATINTATGRCGVITKGIVPVRKSAATVGGDIAKGILAGSTGQVTVPGTAGLGTGTIVARTGSILWVDLDVASNAVS